MRKCFDLRRIFERVVMGEEDGMNDGLKKCWKEKTDQPDKHKFGGEGEGGSV